MPVWFYWLIAIGIILLLFIVLVAFHPSLTFRYRCPACASQNLNRIARSPIARALVFTRAYSCDKCRKHFVRVSLMHPQENYGD